MKITQLTEGYEAFVIPQDVRQRLATYFPPKYPEFIGHHITNAFGVPKRDIKWGDEYPFIVMGHAEDDGIEALVVGRLPRPMDGTPAYIRPDGKVYHITWSLDRSKGWKPVDSNRIITQQGWKPVPGGIRFQAPFQYLV